MKNLHNHQESESHRETQKIGVSFWMDLSEDLDIFSCVKRLKIHYLVLPSSMVSRYLRQIFGNVTKLEIALYGNGIANLLHQLCPIFLDEGDGWRSHAD